MKNICAMKTSFLLLVASIFIFTACEKTENFELPADNNPVDGVWMEVEPEGLMQFEGTTITSLDLHEDFTFTLTFKEWSDMLRVNDPCRGIQDYYAKGKYSVTNNVIEFAGCFTDENHTACRAKCDGQTSFANAYEYVFHGDSLILDPEAHPIKRHVLVRR